MSRPQALLFHHMFNLLPDSEKKKVYETYATRRLRLVLSFLLVGSIVAIFLIIPSILVSRTKEAEAQEQVHTLRSSLSLADADEVGKNISRAREAVDILKVDLTSPAVHALFLSIISEKGSDIKITGLLYTTSADKQKNAISITGIARTRDALLDFAKRLEAVESFSKVTLPISNFTKNKDINFSMGLSGNF
ncbi:MAG: hypothetical protein AAB587_01690 [Patescibacteria group bacterium]